MNNLNILATDLWESGTITSPGLHISAVVIITLLLFLALVVGTKGKRFRPYLLVGGILILSGFSYSALLNTPEEIVVPGESQPTIFKGRTLKEVGAWATICKPEIGARKKCMGCDEGEEEIELFVVWIGSDVDWTFRACEDHLMEWVRHLMGTFGYCETFGSDKEVFLEPGSE